jgi:NADPH:quinone reductase-like Zn-dependent oxidoreductase
MSNLTMKAVRVHDYGGPEVLVLEEVPRPQPQVDQVLVRLLASGVNPVDAIMRAGYFKEFLPLSFPWIPGVEGAGIVAAVGEDVTAFQPGQAVFGFVSGGYAEFAAAPAGDLQPKPAHLTFDQAATVSMGSLVAWQAVIEVANVAAGQRVLVHGAAGGVGLYAVQLAIWRGAHVIGTTSAGNLDFVRSLGAEQVIDYNAARFETVVRDVDVVIDTAGGELIERSWQVLRPNGILVTVAARLAPDAGAAHGVRAVSAGRSSPEKLQQISELLEARKLTPAIRQIFTLSEALQAQELAQSGHGRGRVILLTA